MRTIILNEFQISRLVDKIIAEQTIGEKKLNDFFKLLNKTKEYNISETFNSGQFQIQNRQVIDKAISDIIKEVKDKKNVKFYLKIESSESKVPNQEPYTEPGSLSEARAEQVKRYLESRLPENIEIKIDNKGAQGPNWDTTIGKDSPKYRQFQYVKMFLYAVGNKEIQKIDPKFCKQEFESTAGSKGNPKNNFLVLKPFDVNFGEGVGKINMLFDPASVPDLFVVDYNGKTFSTGFIGVPNDYFRLMLGTILYNYYYTREKPWWFKELLDTNGNKIKNYLEPIDKQMAKNILKKTNWKDKNDISHIYPNTVLDNDIFDKKIKDIDGNVVQLTPYMLTKNAIVNKELNMFQLEKVNDIPSVKVYVYGLIGQTRWRLNLSCE